LIFPKKWYISIRTHWFSKTGSGFLSQVQLQLPGLKRTAPEQNSSFIAGLMKASTLLFRIWKGKADV